MIVFQIKKASIVFIGIQAEFKIYVVDLLKCITTGKTKLDFTGLKHFTMNDSSCIAVFKLVWLCRVVG
jgi:hypothetical protein